MGFIGKFYILSQATIANAWWLISILIIGSGIGLAYYLPIIFKVFSNVVITSPEDKKIKSHLIEQTLIYSLITLGLVLGILPDMVNQLIRS